MDNSAPNRKIRPEVVRKHFLASLAAPDQLTGILDHLGDISVFAKNRDFQLTYGNRHFYERFGFSEGSDFIGKNDFELYPRPLAEKFRADDVRVFSTASPLRNIVELFLNQQGIPDWFITQKVPLFGKDGGVVGLMGAIRRYLSDEANAAETAVSAAARNMRGDPGKRWLMRDLARQCGLSQRQFDRKFHDSYGITPQNYLMKTRIQAACHALRQPGSEISSVSLELGFYDQSAFTVQFRRNMGITPLKYQVSYRT